MVGIRKTLKTAFLLVLILFSALIIYQIFKKILGGSWDTEMVILTMVSANVAVTFVLSIEIGKIKAEFHKSIGRLELSVSQEIYKVREDILEDIHKLDKRINNIETKSRRH